MTSQDVILGLLMHHSLSGYDMKHKMETILSYFNNASFGTIYPTLSKMEKEELITKQSVIQEGRPNKNVYSITEKGREQFKTYMYSPVEDNEFKSDAMTRLFFGEFVEKDVIVGVLEEYLQRTKGHMERLSKLYVECQPEMSHSQEICIQIGINNSESQIRTLTQGIVRLKNLAEK
ncbi:hypothetical protein A8709_12680 [Paenibacillus pectinilyticus]|uniref:Transcription regulator PadR N-terminal domain-containing protein n=1 Tax=Paenibacillus pectinilyticus TaxID=512399 RepID=A0A1C1A351_9BACL|nr:PadR family transcriptional regulator [Paenibacillus pectinilyticus]OCT14979.1 hypothetical protein A8709_12680 [Paenibacillus pectinilyticus]